MLDGTGDAGAFEATIAVWSLVQILLMVIFSIEKSAKGPNLGGDAIKTGTGKHGTISGSRLRNRISIGLICVEDG